ncbi:MAG TPA: hypothetical protein VK906_02080 [Egicoccus sp.]|nr:hypothetical protein [Egicoccus sp.]HSK21931.1 hypothetical protein [Egicoccus sp.]
MKRDRMKVVLQVRENTERRRLAEQVAADLSLRLASERHDDAVVALDGRTAPSVRSTEGLRQHRLGTLALSDAVERARERERLARRDAEEAEQKRVEAAIARRSAERLAERRAAEAALEAARTADSQLDAVALETWRRRA